MHRHINNPIRCRYTSRCSSAEERLKPQPSPLRPATVRQRVGYPLITGRTLDRNQPPALSNSQFYQKLPRCHYSNQPFTGMAQRKRAGLITPRSSDQNGLPVFIIRSFIRSCHAVTQQPLTGMAQGQRARLITARSHDRNVLPVFIFTSQWCIKALEQTQTGVAQRERAGLITPRSGVRITSPVASSSDF